MVILVFYHGLAGPLVFWAFYLTGAKALEKHFEHEMSILETQCRIPCIASNL